MTQEFFPLVGIESLQYPYETCSCQQSAPQSQQGGLQYQTVKKKSNAEHTTQKESPQEKYFCL
jgi:hypothetical protein